MELIKNYNLNTKKIDNKTIVLLSDIHYYSKNDTKKLISINDKIIKLSPNYICITGDIVDESIVLDENLLIKWLQDLSKITKVIISLGNHDITIRDKRHKYEYANRLLIGKIKKINNLYFLDNDIFIDNNICFIGLTNSYLYYKTEKNYDLFIKELDSLKFNISDNNYNVLLCHSPISICKREVVNKSLILKKFDLVLCGHMHAGIVPNFLRIIIKHKGFIGPTNKLFVDNAYGHIIINKINIIISGGITKASHSNKFRVLDCLFRREIVKININKNN